MNDEHKVVPKTVPSTEHKPPLGLLPKHTWEQWRVNNLLDAMKRYADVSKPIPEEWLAELKLLRPNLTRG